MLCQPKESTITPSDHRPQRQRDPGDAGPYAYGLGALLGVVEGIGEDGEGRRHHDGRAHSLDRSAPDEHADGGESAQRREPAVKMARPIMKTRFRPIEVAQRAAGEHEAGQQQDERIDDPLQTGEARAQLALDGGEGQVDDRVVQHHHEEAEAHGPYGEQLDPAVFLEHQARLAHLRADAGAPGRRPARVGTDLRRVRRCRSPRRCRS